MARLFGSKLLCQGCVSPARCLAVLVLATATALTTTLLPREHHAELFRVKLGSLAVTAALGGPLQTSNSSTATASGHSRTASANSAPDVHPSPADATQRPGTEPEPAPPASALRAREPGGGEGLWGQRVGWPCAASGYCSLGKSKTWRGDVATNEALKEMLEAVSYKKEIIFSLSNLEGYILEMSLNVISSAKALGYGHVLILAPSEAACARIPASLNTSCAWDSSPLTDAGELFNNYYRRWQLMARMLRMGYNALSLDADTMLAADFYSFVKQPPFANKNALMQDDGGGVNCGVMYFQGAHPSGPTVWMVVEHVYRTARQREDPEGMRAAYPGWDSGDSWEQPYWNYVLSSVAGGRPYHVVEEKTPKEWLDAMAPYWMGNYFKGVDVQWPQEWRLRTGFDSGPLAVIENLTLPLVGDPGGAAWWAANSKYIYPPKQGDASRTFLELIRSSSDYPLYELGQPWEPAELPAESMAFFPCWFTCPYASRGAFGYWETRPPAQVVLHNVWLPGEWGDWKMYTFKGSRYFNFDILQAIHGNNVLGLPEPKLLMLAPGVELFVPSEEAFLDAVAQLTRLATMMGRRLVVPHPPCDSMWVGVTRNEDHPWLALWRYNYDGAQVLQFTDSTRPGNRTYCHWLRSLQQQCRAVTTPHADMVAFLERLEDRQQAEPGKQNTLWFEEWQAAGAAAVDRMAQPRAITTPQPEVSVADALAVVRAAAAFAEWPVLFLGAVPKLQSEAGLGPLEDSFKQCWLFADERPQFDPVPSVAENRQRWLNGTLTP